jgi:hypothetical protein
VHGVQVLNGSIGVCIDSTEGLQPPVGGGATYQNTVRGVAIGLGRIVALHRWPPTLYQIR